MTKKDYILVGRALSSVPPGDTHGAMLLLQVREALVKAFRENDPRFKPSRFREFVAGRAGPSGGKIQQRSEHAG